MAEKLKVTLVKSPIGAVPKNKKTVAALGLRKINQTNELPDNQAVRGMLRQVTAPHQGRRASKEVQDGIIKFKAGSRLQAQQ